MKLRDLEYLMASAAAGNFTRAAHSLGLGTSTISRRVARLEDELGLAIFERGHAGIRLTAGGKAVLMHARQAVAALEAVKFAGKENGTGSVGEVRLGIRLPPIGAAMRGLLSEWREKSPNVLLTISEMNESDLAIALDERRLDVALAPSHALPARLARLRVFRERLIAALPSSLALARHAKPLTWAAMSCETVLVQGWDETQAEREFLAPLLSSGVCFHSHAAGTLSILTLVAAGFGIAIVPETQAALGYPGVDLRPIDEPNALMGDRSRVAAGDRGACGRPVCRLHARRDPITRACLNEIGSAAVLRRRGRSP